MLLPCRPALKVRFASPYSVLKGPGGLQGAITYGGSVIDLGGGGVEPTPNPAGGGDSIRVLNSCNNGTCQIVEVWLFSNLMHLHSIRLSTPYMVCAMRPFNVHSGKGCLRCRRVTRLIDC